MDHPSYWPAVSTLLFTVQPVCCERSVPVGRIQQHFFYIFLLLTETKMKFCSIHKLESRELRTVIRRGEILYCKLQYKRDFVKWCLRHRSSCSDRNSQCCICAQITRTLNHYLLLTPVKMKAIFYSIHLSFSRSQLGLTFFFEFLQYGL